MYTYFKGRHLEYLTVRLRLQLTITRPTRISGSVRWASLQRIVNSCITTKYLLFGAACLYRCTRLLQGPRVFLSALSVPFVGDLSSPFIRPSLSLSSACQTLLSRPKTFAHTKQHVTNAYEKMRAPTCSQDVGVRSRVLFSMRQKLPAHNKTMDTKAHIYAVFLEILSFSFFLFIKKTHIFNSAICLERLRAKFYF